MHLDRGPQGMEGSWRLHQIATDGQAFVTGIQNTA